MNEQLNKELLKIINDIGEIESTISKIDGAIFIKNSEKLMNEKITYLCNLLQVEAGSFGQNKDNYFDNVERIIAHYKQKLNMVYDEFYCQYVNIQNEIQEARISQRVVMINYQKLINQKQLMSNSPEFANYIQKKKDLTTRLNLSNTKIEYDEIYNRIKSLKSPIEKIEQKKIKLKEQNELYKNIIEKCNQKFDRCRAKFEQEINNEFLIASALEIANEKNIFKKIIYKISNIFTGGKKYLELLENYSKKIKKGLKKQS